MKTCGRLSYLAQFFLGFETFQTKTVEEIKTHILHSVTFFFFFVKSYRLGDNRNLKNMVEPDRPQVTL
jgi:hypothetical protein